MGRTRFIAAAIAALALAAPALSAADFGDFNHANPAERPDPDENPRIKTPNDPSFDDCEADDEDTPLLQECTTYTDESFEYFGFSPDSANQVPGLPHSAAATQYVQCSQLDAQGRDANTDEGDPACSQIAGVRADTAWKYSTGSPAIKIAILDTGIEWQDRELTNKVALNVAELPTPGITRLAPLAGSKPCIQFVAQDDANGDGAVNVLDFACDPLLQVGAGVDDSDAETRLDGSDLIATFSDSTDADGNGYVDDIAGWDFFDNDNDPTDASSCCSAGGHGSDRAKEAAGETNNGQGGVGMCPDCQIMPLRVWDTFVVPGDNYAMGVTYATENGAKVVEGAVGGLNNTQFARRAFEEADEAGVALMLVSSDINSANHNYPTNYNEAVYVGGSLYDTAPNETCSGPGGLPFVEDFIPPPPQQLEEGCDDLLASLATTGVAPHSPGQPVTTSFFRNSNLTQYGGKADVVLMGSTGSANTGKAAGAAGLLASFGRQELGANNMLTGNEIRQLLTMTAEDVLPENTGVIGQPDRANAGWDSHFGYGRVNLAGGMARIANEPNPATPGGVWPCEFQGQVPAPNPAEPVDANCVPPEAQIDAPDWFAPVNVDRLPANGLAVRGRIAAPHSNSGVGAWEVEIACGQDATDSSFQPIPGLSGTGARDGLLGHIPKATLETLATPLPAPLGCDGSVPADAGRPAGTSAEPWPANPYPSPDPERHAIQIRLTVHEADDPANFGRYRKTLHAYQDDGNLSGWPKAIGEGSVPADLVTGSGGEVPPRLYDLDGDNELDVVLGTSSGELYALDSSGQPLQSFNGGQPVRTGPLALASAGRIPTDLQPVSPREPIRAPVLGDIDGDREPEIVTTAGEHVYAWHTDGSVVDGFPVRTDPDLSDPCKPGAPHPCFIVNDRAITSSNHIKRGFMGAATLVDLDLDGKLDIVAGSLDQHLYAWNGDGDLMPADGSVDTANHPNTFPVKLSSAGADGAEIVTSPAVAELDGDPKPEVILATNEVIEGDTPDSLDDLPRAFDLLNAAIDSAGGSNPVYGIDDDGTAAAGWPVKVGVALGDLLPLVLPGHDAAVLNADGDATDEVSVAAATSLASGQGTKLIDGNGAQIRNYENGATNGADQSPIFNLADYSSVGDMTGTGSPQVYKGGLTANGALNLFAVNQNLPFNHVIQGWDPQTGAAVSGYPRATDDFQLVSQPAIARVGGTGPSRQVLYGTGMYQLHAYGLGGTEPTNPVDPATSWPKFTGGWTQATPSVGDADGDGTLDVVAVTREGWAFLWKTTAPSCEDAAGTTNEEWWTFHHDEFGSANYGTDARPPGSPEDLTVSSTATGKTVSWTVPGDDWLCGSPGPGAKFEIRLDDSPIDDPGDGTVVAQGDNTVEPEGDAEKQLTTAEIANATHVAVLYRDDAGNWGRLASAPLNPPPTGGGGDGGGGGTGGGDAGGGTGGGTGGGGGGVINGAPTGCANVIDGSGGRDTLRGSDFSDRIRAEDGDDTIDGAGGSDCIDAGDGNDQARGSDGNDKIGGDDGDDKLLGDDGKDKIIAGDDRDKVKGGDGNDTIRAGSDGTRDKINCGAGKDTAIVDDKDKLKNCEKVTASR